MNLRRLHRNDQEGFESFPNEGRESSTGEDEDDSRSPSFDLSEETADRIESPRETETCNRRFCNRVPVLFSDYCGDHMGDES